MNLWASQQAFQWHKFVFVVMSSLTVSYGIMMVWHGTWLVHQIARWWFMIMCRLAMYKPAWRGLWEETHRSQLPGRCSPVIIYAVRVLHGIQYVDMQLMSEALWCSTGAVTPGVWAVIMCSLVQLKRARAWIQFWSRIPSELLWCCHWQRSGRKVATSRPSQCRTNFQG